MQAVMRKWWKAHQVETKARLCGRANIFTIQTHPELDGRRIYDDDQQCISYL